MATTATEPAIDKMKVQRSHPWFPGSMLSRNKQDFPQISVHGAKANVSYVVQYGSGSQSTAEPTQRPARQIAPVISRSTNSHLVTDVHTEKLQP